MWQGFRGFMRHCDAGWSEFRFKMPPKMPENAMFIVCFPGMLSSQRIVQYGIGEFFKNNAKNPLAVGIT